MKVVVSDKPKAKVVAMKQHSDHASFSFGKSYRLLAKQDYQTVFNKPEKVSDNCFLILVYQKKQGSPRLGLAIAKKVARLAIQRNSIKRVIRESFRLNKKKLSSFDIVVMIRSDAVRATHTELYKKLEILWNKLQLKVE